MKMGMLMLKKKKTLLLVSRGLPLYLRVFHWLFSANLQRLVDTGIISSFSVFYMFIAFIKKNKNAALL